MTINTVYARYCHCTLPTAKIGTATLCNHHRPTAIPAGSTQDNPRSAPRGRSQHNLNHHIAMVKYIIATLQAMVGAKPTGPTDKIHERPTFSTVCHLQIQLVDGLRKLVNFKFPLDSHSGCILLKEAFSLFSSKECRYPKEVG